MPDTSVKKVVLELKDAVSSMNLRGAVFAAADPDHPLRPGVDIRKTTSANLFLAPGKYLYVFDVQSGSGAFTVVASSAGQGTLAGNTSDGTTGRKLRFKVVG